MLFKDLNLIPSILSALETQGYSTPTPVQAAAIPSILEGKDLIGCAQTGTGKTAAFALPILQNLMAVKPATPGQIRALILTPTRELAAQIQDNFNQYGKNLPLRNCVIFGGVGESPQKAQLRRGVDIVIATPGRLIDLLGQRALTLSHLEIFTLDEADRMLDMGFVHDVRRICALLPAKRQTLFFSATMPPEIRKLADGLLRNPVKVEVTPVSSTAEKIEQGIYFIRQESKSALLKHVLSDPKVKRALVFTRTKHGADRLRKTLDANNIPSEAIHGNKSQGARIRSLANFKEGITRVLVATDLAARGIDVDDITHVVNYDLPAEAETYVHRIGRTARAGASGISVSFCGPDDRGLLAGIERLIQKRIQVMPTPEFDTTLIAPPRENRSNNGRPQHGGRQGSQIGERSHQGSREGGRQGGRQGGRSGGHQGNRDGGRPQHSGQPQVRTAPQVSHLAPHPYADRMGTQAVGNGNSSRNSQRNASSNGNGFGHGNGNAPQRGPNAGPSFGRNSNKPGSNGRSSGGRKPEKTFSREYFSNRD